MATVYVNSGAAGLNDGTSWTNAYTSLASTNGAAAGDIVKVHKAHSQTGLAANINWSNGTVANPVRVICVDKDSSDALATGASVEWTTTALGPQGNIFAYGTTWKQTGAILRLSPASDGVQIYESCTFSPTGTSGVDTNGSRVRVVWRSVTVDFSGASNAAVGINYTNAGSGCAFEWIGGTYTCRATQTSLFTVGAGLAQGGGAAVRGVNFSGTVTNLVDGSSVATGTLQIIACTLPTYTNVYGTAGTNPNGAVNLDGSVAGTITVATLPPNKRTTRQGVVATSLARYRTGGADDGSQANSYSWELAAGTNAGAFVDGLMSPLLTRWAGTGSQTVTVYVASGVTLNDDEFWIEVLSPSEAGSATAQAKYQTTRCVVLATPAAVTTDGTSTWTGTGVGTKQKCSVTINPTVPGPITIIARLAKASTTVYVDPVIDLAGDVAGKSRFMEGAQQFAATSGGAAGMLYHTGGG